MAAAQAGALEVKGVETAGVDTFASPGSSSFPDCRGGRKRGAVLCVVISFSLVLVTFVCLSWASAGQPIINDSPPGWK
jgi:hypothetical protein